MFINFIIHNDEMCPVYTHNLVHSVTRFNRVAIDPFSSVEKFVYFLKYTKLYDGIIYSTWLVIIGPNDKYVLEMSKCEPHEIILKERLAAPEYRNGVMCFYTNNSSSPLMNQLAIYHEKYSDSFEIEDKMPVIPLQNNELFEYVKWKNGISYNIFDDDGVFLGSIPTIAQKSDDELMMGNIYMC